MTDFRYDDGVGVAHFSSRVKKLVAFERDDCEKLVLAGVVIERERMWDGVNKKAYRLRCVSETSQPISRLRNFHLPQWIVSCRLSCQLLVCFSSNLLEPALFFHASSAARSAVATSF